MHCCELAIALSSEEVGSSVDYGSNIAKRRPVKFQRSSAVKK